MLHNLNHSGTLSETIDFETKQHWGNFPHNSAMVGLITSAIRLSVDWTEAV